MVDHVDLGLTDADGLEEDVVLAGGVHQQRRLQRASASPPSAPRVAIERMKTPGSRKCSLSRMRSPSSAPPRNGELGSIDSTATVALLRALVLDERADQRRLARSPAAP